RGRKRGFALPLDRWLRHDDWLPDLLSAERTRQRPHLRRDGLVRMLDLHRAGRAQLGHALYLVAALELHLRAREAVDLQSAPQRLDGRGLGVPA
ncbi:MAG: hypothetical protein KDC87_04495, partial [Planctomycetes bacterium]|nr:hypothetical protein [Planctomycetota bacterium]